MHHSLCKTGTEKGESSLAKVYYKDVYGKKKEKFDFLEQNNLLALDFEEITPTSPMFFFSQSRRTWKQNSVKDSLLKSSL